MDDYLQALFGGCLIGLSAVLLMLSLGKIAGISGIFNSLISRHEENSKSENNKSIWLLLFILGLPTGAYFSSKILGYGQPVSESAPVILIIIAGLLVGFGTRIGSGCTSGHGVCGISRFSVRSLTATLIFMGVGVVTVFVMSVIF